MKPTDRARLTTSLRDHVAKVLVVPGVIHNRQPRFNEGPAMWHLEGATLPLLNPLPGGAA